MADDKKLSIAFLYDDTLDSDNGVAQNVRTLGAWFSARGHKVSYCAGETKKTTWAGGKIYSLSKNIEVNFNGNRLSMPLFSRQAAIKQALAEIKPDVIHVTVPYSPFMAQRLINRSPKTTAVVGAFHILPANFIATVGNYLLRFIYGRSLKRLDYMMGTSQPAADFAHKALGIKTGCIANPLDTAKFKPSKPTKPTKAKIVFLGRLVKRKGCEHLLEAFSIVAAKNEQATLQIIGDGPQRARLKEKVAKF